MSTLPVERLPLRDYAEKAYLEYSMFVILDRALPHIGDGLKPVQRRILYAMSELGLKATAKFKKSARTVGDVLGKFHPHGDTACYEALVLMAQPFSYRYPLIGGQGNFGSMDDPKSFAAMRYTESRLSAYADTLLNEVDLGTVEWMPNFDGTLTEPRLLPARLPNILLNGTTGIAVGMATDIPPHNLREIVNACLALLEDADISLEKIMDFVQGPDFPSNAEIITPRSDILDMYRTGNGSLRQRSVYHCEEGDIVITALPYQVSGAKVLEQIAAQMQSKKLTMISDLRDESDHENPVRLIIVPRSNRIEIETLMAHLFATTDLERSYRVNLNVIGLDGKPRVKNLKEMLQEWLVYRTDVVKRRLQYRLDQVGERLHLLEGLLIAFLNLDKVIKIVREEEKPKPVLMTAFKLSELQADTILETKLRHLARLEEMKIREEQTELAAEQDNLEKTLQAKQKLKNLIRKELEADAKQYGDARQSPLVKRQEAQIIKEIDMSPSEPITVILSQKGWVRAAKGHDIDIAGLSYKSGDSLQSYAKGRSQQLAIFLDNTGRAYSVSTQALPSARGQGEPLTAQLNPPPGAAFIAVLMGELEQAFIFASSAGYGFIGTLENCVAKNRAGKALVTIPEGATLLTPCLIEEKENKYVAALTNEGRLLLFLLNQLPDLTKGKGNKMIHIPSARVIAHEEYVVGIIILKSTDSILISSGKRKLILKPTDWKYYIGERGRRGNKIPKGYQRAESIEISPRDSM